jgi:hypothetical protein
MWGERGATVGTAEGDVGMIPADSAASNDGLARSLAPRQEVVLLEALLARGRTRRDELIRVLAWRLVALLIGPGFTGR